MVYGFNELHLPAHGYLLQLELFMKSLRFALAILGMLFLLSGCATKGFLKSNQPKLTDMTEREKEWVQAMKKAASALTDEEIAEWEKKNSAKVVLGFTECRACHKSPTAKKRRWFEAWLRNGDQVF